MPIRLTVGVRAILIACFVLFIVLQTSDQFFGTHLFEVLALVPSAVTRELRVWQLFTYSFVHRDITHLFFNLLMLAFIGSELELVWGKRKFLKYYFFCATSAALIYWLLGSFVFPGSGYHPMAGSSGAIYGLLLAYGVLFGDRVLLFMMLFPMKAKHFVAVLALLELLTTLYSSGGALASLSQLGAMASGFAYLVFLARRARRLPGKPKPPKKKRSNHLKLIINNPQNFENPSDESGNGPKTWH